MGMPTTIYVSYRRNDDPGAAMAIVAGLDSANRDKYKFFIDVDQMRAGQRFDQEMDKALGACDVLIAILGSRWMDLLKANEGSGEPDYVRKEIAAALKRNIIVVPVR